MKKLRVIISGGGTGGHIFPAIAIAKAFKENYPETEILFVGALGKMEMEKVPAAGFEIVGLPIRGIQRRLTLKNFLVPLYVIRSLIKARKIIKNFQPDIAIGVGGYASGPILRAAASMGVKTLLQEQNSYAGVTNRLLSKKADRICVAYEGLEKFFPKEKIVITGNPVRPEVLRLEGKKERGIDHFKLDPTKKTILVVGGSLGARTINHAIRASLNEFQNAGLQLVWQTGKSYYAAASSAADAMDTNAIHPFEFIREMDLAYASADIIVSRAGAMSISELCLARKPVILIPSPNVSEDHQTKNAMALVQRGAALMIPDAEARQRLSKELIALSRDENKMFQLGTEIAALGKPDATARILACAMELLNPEKATGN